MPITLNMSRLMHDHPNIIESVPSVSSKTGDGIDRLVDVIKQSLSLLDNLEILFPPRWAAVRKRLESVPRPLLQFSEYEGICREERVPERERRPLINILNNLGVVMHYGDDLTASQIIVLSPSWIISVMQNIFAASGLYENLGVISGKKLRQLLSDMVVDADGCGTVHVEEFVIAIMRRFAICFEFSVDFKEQFLFPSTLPVSVPYIGEWNETLNFQFRYEILPPAIMSRFIVRMRDSIWEKTYWRTGAIISNRGGGNRALVSADIENARIDIRIDGVRDERRRLLSGIRLEFERIHESFPHLGVKEYVPIAGKEEVVVSYRRLLELERHGILQDYVEGLDDFVNVSDLLEGAGAGRPYVFISYASKLVQAASTTCGPNR